MREGTQRRHMACGGPLSSVFLAGETLPPAKVASALHRGLQHASHMGYDSHLQAPLTSKLCFTLSSTTFAAQAIAIKTERHMIIILAYHGIQHCEASWVSFPTEFAPKA